MASGKTAAIIVAAGAGLRLGGELPKQYQSTWWPRGAWRGSIDAFLDHPGIDMVQVVVGSDHRALYEEAVSGLDLPAPVIGGETRQASVKAGLDALTDLNPQYVLIHDAARPFVSHEIISHVIANLDRHDGALPALPIADTVKRASGSIVSETLDRSTLYGAQTPARFSF